MTDDLLVYATGGLAYGRVNHSGQFHYATPVDYLVNDSSTQVGWTAGAGIEGRIGGNWTAKLEYLYMDLGTVSAGPIATTILGPVRLPVGASYSSHFTDNILRVGFNYIFNAPVAAKY